jgi:cholesterol transport system auxiliary component
MRSPTRRDPLRPARRGALLLCTLAALFAIGCALTSKSEAIAPRYFSPERAGGIARTGAKSMVELRLGHIESAPHLDERIVFRDSDYELGYYEERRWTEGPEQYLKRRLERALFEERGLHRVVGGVAPTLEVELTAFEEIRAPRRIARVEVMVRLQDQRFVRWEETLTIDQPILVKAGGDAAEATVAALGLALGAVVDRIADRAVLELTAPPAAAVAALTAGHPAER